MLFIFTKIFAMLPFGNFLRGPLGKIVMVVAAIIIAIGAFNIWMSSHDAQVRDETLAVFNQSQLEKTLQDQAEFDQRMRETLADQQEMLNALNNERSVLHAQAENVLASIQSGELAGGEASEVLRETIRALDERRILWEGQR